MSTCSTLISHLSKLTLATQSPADADEEHASPQGSFTPPLERAPVRAESDPTGSPSAYLLRRDRDEMLIVPSATSLTRKRSKKEKRRNAPVAKVRGKNIIIIIIVITIIIVIIIIIICPFPAGVQETPAQCDYFHPVQQLGSQPA